MELILIRHGQTVNNNAGKHQGWYPVELSELGRQQADHAHVILKNQDFDRIIVSDLLRTKQTAEIIFRDRMDKIEYSSAIREIDTSVLYGHTYDETIAKYGEVYIDARKRLDYSFFGGESDITFNARIGEFLNEFEQPGVEQKVAVVTHGGVISAILAYILHTDIEHVSEKFSIDNCGVSSINYCKNGWRIKYWNCCI